MKNSKNEQNSTMNKNKNEWKHKVWLGQSQVHNWTFFSQASSETFFLKFWCLNFFQTLNTQH
jgi:hypothetical protein